MYGDYEAQRHWMEITYNLKIANWYVNSTDNDLNYWGLDYPPLTAYHSFILGYIANKIDPKYVELFTSRGMETYEHRLFMRSTVLAFDLLIFFPSAFYLLHTLFYTRLGRKHSSTKRTTSPHDPDGSYFDLTRNDKDFLVSLLLALLNPTLVLVDHGHFQYNSISLGLFQLGALFLLLHRRRCSNPCLALASLFFCLALNYKQMELYHALPMFFYLLGLCVVESRLLGNGLLKLTVIGVTVVGTFAALWLPFALNGPDMVLQVLNRIFPFQRGLFEDKVANFWCSLSVVVKLRELFPIQTLSRLSLALTGLLNLPSAIDLFLRPSRQRFMLASVNSALIFYLFSFQVHEKSILLATVPACLLINFQPFFVSWFILVANFSMLPLLVKDGLFVPFVSTSVLFVSIVLYYYLFSVEARRAEFWPSLRLISGLSPLKRFDRLEYSLQSLLKTAFIASIVGMIVLSACQIGVRAPARYPDLWTVANCVFGCAHFVVFAAVFHAAQFTLANGDHGDKTTQSSVSSSADDRSYIDSLRFSFNCCFTPTRKSHEKKSD